MKRRPGFFSALRERGCAVLVLLFMLAPVWVLSIAWRGRVLAFLVLGLTLLLVLGLAVAGRWVRRGR